MRRRKVRKRGVRAGKPARKAVSKEPAKGAVRKTLKRRAKSMTRKVKANGKSDGAARNGARKRGKPPTSFNGTGGNGDASAGAKEREFLRKLAKAAPGVFHLVLGLGWAAVGARTWTGNDKHAAAAWWVELLRVVRKVSGIEMKVVEQCTGLKRQAFHYHDRQERSPRLDSMLREADTLEIPVAAVALTADLWHRGHAAPFARVLRAVRGLWKKVARLFPSPWGKGLP